MSYYDPNQQQPQQPSGPNWQQPQQSPQPNWQQPQYPGQQPSGPSWPPQQPPWQQPGMPPQYPMPPQQPPRKSGRLWVILLIIAIVACAGVGLIANAGNNSSSTATVTATASDNGAQSAATNSAQLDATNAAAPTATDTPTPTPIPTQSSAQIESSYKKSTTNTTVDNLDKNGNAFKGKDVHFTCKILAFVKDSNGNTAGANVESPDTYSASVIQIGWTSGTDITRLNEGDIVEVWGNDLGVFSGQNAFGGTVQEVGIAALYMNDKTTGYQTH